MVDTTMAVCREHPVSRCYTMRDAVAAKAAHEDELDKPIKRLAFSIVLQAIEDARGHDAAASDARDFLLRRIWHGTDCICELVRHYVPFAFVLPRTRKILARRVMV